MILREFLIDLKSRWLQSGLADMEKHKILPFVLMVDFLRTFKKNTFFEIFKRFLKIIRSTC